MSQTPLPPPGWYPESGQERWWNGASWSDTYRPLQPAQPAQPTAGPPYGQPAPGYPAPGFQQPYQPPPSTSHTLRTVLIVIGVLVVLFVGGCTALVVVVGNKVDNVVNDDTPGGPVNPLTITPGKGFEVAGFVYADGWQVGPDDAGDLGVTDLVVTNNRDKSDFAFVTIKLLSGNEVVATSECTASTTKIAQGTTVTLGCISGDTMPTDYDQITIQDTF